MCIRDSPLRPTLIQSTTNNFPYPPPASETIVESSAHRPARSLQSARPKPVSHGAANEIIPQLSRPSVGPVSVLGEGRKNQVLQSHLL